MMTLQHKILAIVGGIAVVLAIISFFLLVKPFSEDVEPVREQIYDEITGEYIPVEEDAVYYDTNESVVDKAPSAAPAAPIDQERLVRQFAELFVERFATYSNQNNNQHLADVSLLVTPGMLQWVDAQRTARGSAYEGVTTAVLATKVTSMASSTASVFVQSQQTISHVNGTSEVSMRDGRVELVLLEEGWKVSGLYWE